MLGTSELRQISEKGKVEGKKVGRLTSQYGGRALGEPVKSAEPSL